MTNTSSHFFELKNYKTIIFDFDGVILDSNSIKKLAIQSSVENILDEVTTKEFVDYFVNLNGVPREQKIAKYLPVAEHNNVLKNYEEILDVNLKDANLICGVKELIQNLYALKIKLYVLSGGAQIEVINLLKFFGLFNYFDGVFGGPKNKEQNLEHKKNKKPVLYFGDSKVDYAVSKEHHFDFVFVYGASSIKNWQDETKNWDISRIIKNFREL